MAVLRIFPPFRPAWIDTECTCHKWPIHDHSCPRRIAWTDATPLERERGVRILCDDALLRND